MVGGGWWVVVVVVVVVVGMAANCHLRRRRNALGNTETMPETSVDFQRQQFGQQNNKNSRE